MCQNCPLPHESQESNASQLPRRNFLKLAGAAALGLGLASVPKSQAAGSLPPKPENVVTPDEALERLLQGNTRYVKGTMRRHDFIAERPALAMGQNPYAGILSCADSRVGPEYAFDSGRGDLFVCRVAGNFADVNTIASFEYGVAVLGVPLIMVLGHASCGAVQSTIDAVENGTKFPGHIPSLVNHLRPAVKATLKQPGNPLVNATKANVVLNVRELRESNPILSKAIAEKKLKIIGGYYNLDTGRVELLEA